MSLQQSYLLSYIEVVHITPQFNILVCTTRKKPDLFSLDDYFHSDETTSEKTGALHWQREG